MTTPGLSKIDRLRARDGDDCWLCEERLDFSAAPNSKKAPTKEHLQPLSMGGTGALDNLVLCHPGCNRQLGCRSRPEKEKMRDRRRAKAKLARAPNAKPTASVKPKAASVAKVGLPVAHVANPIDWRTVAWTAIAAAMFFAGLATGLWLGR